MHSRCSRALLACRGLCEPLEAAQNWLCESSFATTLTPTAQHVLSTLPHTRINHLPRKRARSRSVRQQDSAAKQQSKMMSSMHRR